MSASVIGRLPSTSQALSSSPIASRRSARWDRATSPAPHLLELLSPACAGADQAGRSVVATEDDRVSR